MDNSYTELKQWINSYTEFQRILAEMKAKIAEREKKTDSEIWNSIFGELKRHNMC